MDPWTLLHRRPGPAGHLEVVTERYRLPGGVEVEWDLVAGRDSVAVVALTADRHVVVVRQYRPGPRRILDELPGGGVEDGETPAEAAARELLEETGYVGSTDVVAHTWLAGNVRRRRWAVLATDCEPRRAPSPDVGEHCEPILLSLAEFRAHLRSGQLTDVDIGYLCLDHRDLL